MSTTAKDSIANAGRAGWTRDLARDLFPGRTMPFTWTLLGASANRALANVYAELGGQADTTARFWRLDRGYGYLNAAAVAEADQSLCGAGWLGQSQPPPPAGLRARLQAGGVVKRCQSRLAVAAGEASGLQSRLSRWLAWVQGVKWTQADLLQVMEELEPHALAALQTHFLARIGLNVADAAFEAHLREWLPGCPPDVAAAAALGATDLPSVVMAEAVLDAARREPTSAERLATLARCSHRGPGEIRPDAARWPDAPDLLEHLAEQGEPAWTPALAAAGRQGALAALGGSLTGGQFRELQAVLAGLAGAMRTADIAWDSLTLVMAAAQRWVTAAGRETLAAGLIGRPEDVLYLELEELKQVATGEWHAGDREAVEAAVAERMQAIAVAPDPVAQPARVVICPGACEGPLYCDSPREVLPRPGSAWVAETVDPGCVPLWGFAGCLVAAGDDPWTPGLVAARALGVPARLGIAPGG